MKTQKPKYSSPFLVQKRRERFRKQFTANNDEPTHYCDCNSLAGPQVLAVLTAGVLLLHGDASTRLKTLRFLFGNNPLL